MLIGLVGKPNCGKSTFFKACTLANVAIAPYPFTTIKPNHGMGYVGVECVDKEFNLQCMPRTGFCLKGTRFVPVELLDVAGLVPGASAGKGLGNQFLDDLRQADLFVHIVDASGKTDIEGKPAQNHNPCEDIEFLERELDLWYLGILKKVWKTFSKGLSNSKEGTGNFAKAVAKQFSGLKLSEENIKKTLLKTKLDATKAGKWDDDELLLFVHNLRTINKPMIIAANKCDLPEAEENIKKLKEKYPQILIIPCSADSELALREAAKAGLIEYIPGERKFEIIGKSSARQKNALESIKKNVIDVYGGTGVQQVLDRAVFEFLNYIAVFPVENKTHLSDSKGNILPDCYLLPGGSTALDFAFAIHTDIGKNFVKAIDARTGRAVGKDYKIKHRDVLEIAIK